MRNFLIALAVTLYFSSFTFAQDSNQLDRKDMSMTSDIRTAFNLTEANNFTALSQAEMAETKGGPKVCWTTIGGDERCLVW